MSKIYRMAHRPISRGRIAFYGTLAAGALLLAIALLAWAWGG